MELLKNFIRTYVAFPLYRLARKLELWQFKRAIRLRSLAKLNVMLDIRLSDPKANQEGYDKSQDTIIYTAADKITNPEWFDEALSKEWKRKPFQDNPDRLASLVVDYTNNSDEVEKLIELASTNLYVKKWLSTYLRIQCYIVSKLGEAADIHETKYWAVRLAELDDNAEPIKTSEIESLISQAKRDLKASRFALSDREAMKIPLSFEWVGSIISMLSALLLFSGFTYTFVFYGFFGVPISHYFSVADYVSSSIEQLYAVFFSVFLGLAFVFFGAHAASRRPTIVIEEQRKKPDHFNIFVSGVIVIALIGGLFNGGRLLHQSIGLSILLAGFLIIPHLAARFFNDRLRAMFMLVVVFTLASHVYRTVHSNIYDVLEGEAVPRICEQFHISSADDNIMPPCGSAVIGLTERYVFIFDKEKSNTVILPRSRVTQGVFRSPLFKNNWFNRLSHWWTGLIVGEEMRDKLRGTVDTSSHQKNLEDVQDQK